MAVDADQVDAIAASIADIYRESESALVRLVARHLSEGLDSPAAEQRLGTIRALRRGAQAVIASLEADSGPAIRDGLARSYRHGWTNATAGLPERFMPRSGIGQAAREAAKERSGTGFVEALAAALHGDFGRVTRNILRNVEDAYRSVQAAAAARILTGAETRRQSAQAAWQRLVDRGIMSFTDRAGRRWRLSSYVEMAARTNVQRAATTGQVDRLDSIGVNLVLVSNSPQECKLCRPFEGKILRTDDGPLNVQVEHPTRDGVMTTVEAYATLDQARSAGLFHPNCRHSVSVYLPGVSKLPKPPLADPEGDKARQRQRELERRIRRQKERAEAALTPEARKAANARVRRAQADLRDHLAANPELKRLRYREQPGAGNTPPRGGPQGGPAGDLGPPREPTLDGGPAPRPPSRTRRVDDRDQPPALDRQPAPDQPELESPPLPRLDPRTLPDDDLERRMLEALERDPDEFERLAKEVDRRDVERRAAEARRAANRERAERRREQQAEERAERMEELLGAGVPEEEAIEEVYGISIATQRRRRAIDDLRAEGFTGRGFEDLARASYKDHVHRQWLAAERATRGALLNRAGEARGIDPGRLFSGPEATARKWASDELKAWWDQHGRMTFAEWKAQLLDDSGAIRRLRDQGGGDFLI
ncbi:phage minor capsid protein [Actinomadura decatromicini]|uniref:Phage capsid protein n=1 Tax=Actinomadura decatromicini TaxID=2604572 RepID=A0A5D3FGL1_9ACTN|nr:phage minor capsid protein [Actinomadura decatromicini]TYK47164.1 phage capsid protein [Actinomadura decatromicini]